MYLYGAGCNYLATLGKFKVDAGGDGSKVGSLDVSSGVYVNSFFVDVYGTTDNASDTSRSRVHRVRAHR